MLGGALRSPTSPLTIELTAPKTLRHRDILTLHAAAAHRLLAWKVVSSFESGRRVCAAAAGSWPLVLEVSA